MPPAIALHTGFSGRVDRDQAGVHRPRRFPRVAYLYSDAPRGGPDNGAAHNKRQQPCPRMPVPKPQLPHLKVDDLVPATPRQR